MRVCVLRMIDGNVCFFARLNRVNLLFLKQKNVICRWVFCCLQNHPTITAAVVTAAAANTQNAWQARYEWHKHNLLSIIPFTIVDEYKP